MRIIFATLLLLSLAGDAFAQVRGSSEPLVFGSEEEQLRFNELATELRCLVCQNQNLADSDATLAHDLRQEVFEMMQDGLDDDQIKQFLVDRYGDFVLYKPPVKANTLVLWAGPAILLLAGALAVFLSIRRRNSMLAGPGAE